MANRPRTRRLSRLRLSPGFPPTRRRQTPDPIEGTTPATPRAETPDASSTDSA
ncbi:hypothetical protein AB0A05_17945 [Streptomyces sp. NPDC046374]|uniref:hypothetical protein n=1 Tax=Streptomyces sp. NPDC046374 TaxID=3154917 RepID=UPI0034062B6B